MRFSIGVRIPASGVTRTRFFVDDPQMTGAPRQTENNPPWDLAGTASGGGANPFDTTGLADGPHTVTAAIDRDTGATEVVHATFTVANGGGGSAFSLLVSTAPDRSDPAGLEGATRTENYLGLEVGVGGDLVVAIEGEPVTGAADVARILTADYEPGDRVGFTVVRGGERRTVAVVLGERSPQPRD